MQTIQSQMFFKAAEGRSLFADVMAALRLMKKRRVAYNTTVEELSVLTDRELGDIGMNRSDIRGIARMAAEAV